MTGPSVRTEEPALSEYRIDDLAREAGTTVRSLRVLHDKGLLPAPTLRGRVGWYHDDHLTRVRLVLRLQERGFTLGAIAHLLTAWETGRDLGDVLGLEDALTRPWSDEAVAVLTQDELVARFGEQATPERIARTERLGMLRRQEDGTFTTRSLRLVDVGAGLVAVGLSLDQVLDLTETMRTDMSGMTQRITTLVGDHMLAGVSSQDGLPEAEKIAQLTAAVNAMRTLARISVEEWFAITMDEAVADLVGSMGKWAREDTHSSTPQD